MKEVTTESLIKAYNSAIRGMDRDAGMTAKSVSAGFAIPAGQKRGKRRGYQVFVKVARFDEELLKSDPVTGGLIEMAGAAESPNEP